MHIARVEWSDPRAVALRDAMQLEMDALYRNPATASVPEVLPEGIFAVDPAEVVVTLLALHDGAAVGHAALRPYQESFEVKKVFVDSNHRGLGIARMLMEELDLIARQNGVHRLVLQTGTLQGEAIRLYERLGYQKIAPFRNYGLLTRGLCYAKALAVG
ncbi:MAG: GNAT family N-acetyltransferase [Rhodoglobus sp.]